MNAKTETSWKTFVAVVLADSALIASVFVLGSAFDGFHPSTVVGTVEATSEDSLEVSYQSGEWLFSDPVTGTFETVVGCPTEDSCAIDYSNGKWTVTRQTP